MSEDGKAVYTARVHTEGGRGGRARSSDGRLDIILSTPGGSGSGTNPEQLFAAGWSACFEAAMATAARKLNVVLPRDPVIDAEVELKTDQGGYAIGARLNVTLSGLDRDTAQCVVDTAHQTCPYSKATRGNIEVEINLL